MGNGGGFGGERFAMNTLCRSRLQNAADFGKIIRYCFIVTVRISSTLLKPAVCLLLGASAVLYSRPADAAVFIYATESGGNVVFNYSGSINVNTFSPGGGGSTFIRTDAYVSPATPSFYSPGSSGSFVYFVNVFIPSMPTFGTGATGDPYITTSFNSSGDMFSFDPNNIALRSGYVSGSSFSGSVSFTGTTFAQRGMMQGTYIGTLTNNDTITLNVGTAAVPAPLPILGLPSAFFYTRKLRKRIKASKVASNPSLD